MCPKCGAANQPGTAFCSNCGTALMATVPPVGSPAYGAPPMPAYGYPAGPWALERTKQIDRTKTGLLLMLIGGLISWIPLIGLLGSLLLLIGAILVIVGRKAFGATHSRNVVLAIVLFFVGIVAGVVLGVVFALASFSSLTSSDPQTVANAFANALNALLLGAIIIGAISGLGSVLFTYALQQQTGKMLLWAGYVAGLLVNIAIFAIITPLITAAVASAVAGGTYNPAPLVALQTQEAGLALLAAVPAVLFAAATYLAWTRVSRGEIPPPAIPPGMPSPPMAPPSGPAPPINPQ